ncbi:serine hydrolase [Stutzerimonas stutzeri]|uniref:serine hydrolase n=1 Tax=Stutzerimonas stutzeri TaxID=316 RepID=UPI0015E175B3|nr:serine hydrolase [Stutzerimonas stutzeri]MCQ4262262.1 class A beta-lactamase-related serine hydrolase [Stutzerimonas stutzeri]
MNRLIAVGALLLPLAGITACTEDAEATWKDGLEQELRRIDDAAPGKLGVYIKHLGEDAELRYEAERFWYLGSAVKVPIAIAVLQGVDDGDFRLDQQLSLEAEDKVDGSGDLVWQDVGVDYAVRDLLNEMLIESDNTAANMLIRLVGEDDLNARTRKSMGSDFEAITTFTQVRRDVYGEVHPDAARLDNMQLVELASAPFSKPRYDALTSVLNLSADELKAASMEEAYERYYARNLNASSLVAYGAMLEKLVLGELLSAQSRELLYGDMKIDSYDNYRLEAGLPEDVPFIQKTGTQLERACHVGVIEPRDESRAIVVVACAEDLDEGREAGRLFEQVGEAISEALLEARQH